MAIVVPPTNNAAARAIRVDLFLIFSKLIVTPVGQEIELFFVPRRNCALLFADAVPACRFPPLWTA
jgi:hypothetical protein